MEPGQAASKRSLKSGRQRMAPEWKPFAGDDHNLNTATFGAVPMRRAARTVPGNLAGWSADLCPLRFLFAFYQAGLRAPGGWRAKVLTGKGIKKQKIGYRLEGLGQFCEHEVLFWEAEGPGGSAGPAESRSELCRHEWRHGTSGDARHAKPKPVETGCSKELGGGSLTGPKRTGLRRRKPLCIIPVS